MPDRFFRTPDNNAETRYPLSWRYLGWFFFFRLALAGLLVLIFVFGTGPTFLGQSFPTLFSITSITYLALVIASGRLLRWQAPSVEQQAYLMVFTDIIAITLLMHSSGGVESGLGMLLLVSIAGGSLLMAGQAALLFAALASLAILSEQVYAQITRSFTDTAYTQAGLLGASFFAMALLAHLLSLRIRESEQLATQRGLDLADMAELNEYIIQHMRTGVLAVDDRHRIRLINNSAAELLGTPETVTDLRLAQISPELSLHLAAWHKDEQHAKTAVFRSHPGGREVKPGFAKLGDSGAAGTLIFLEDNAVVTQKAQQLKLASLGRLTASIAHEIRNPLGAIGHAGQLMEESPELNPDDRRLTEIIRNNTARVNEVIENILQLSRRTASRTELIDLSSWLEKFAESFRSDHGLGQGKITVEEHRKQIAIRTDTSQIRQVLSILCENSLDHGVKQENALKIKLRCDQAPGSESAFVEVIDNGPGIAPEVANQVFEPFFTTRNAGTGLGLYIARELSESNQVRLEYLPVPRGGSCFRLSFPDPRKRELIA